MTHVMNLPEAEIEARRRFGDRGVARELPIEVDVIRQVGLTVPDTTKDDNPDLSTNVERTLFMVLGAGRTFEDAFTRAMRPGTGLLLALQGGIPLGETPQMVVYGDGIDLRLPASLVEVLSRALDDSDDPDDDEAIERIARLLNAAIHAMDVAAQEFHAPGDPARDSEESDADPYPIGP